MNYRIDLIGQTSYVRTKLIFSHTSILFCVSCKGNSSLCLGAENQRLRRQIRGILPAGTFPSRLFTVVWVQLYLLDIWYPGSVNDVLLVIINQGIVAHELRFVVIKYVIKRSCEFQNQSIHNCCEKS